MRVAVFSSKSYTEQTFDAVNASFGHELVYLEPRLDRRTATLAAGFKAVCAFVNDELDAGVLGELQRHGVRLIAMRCAGLNNVDLGEAARLGLTVMNVPAYSPYAVAEHAVALMLALNRRIHKAFNRVREGNFSLEGLTGFDMHGSTVGIVGTGKIGVCVARILNGFGCRLLTFDIQRNPEVEALGARYVELPALFAHADIVTLHCPLVASTRHLIDAASLNRMRRGAMLINTSRGALVDTAAVVEALKSGQLGYLGLDVYEEEEDLFFEDRSQKVLLDDTFARLLTFPNVIITGHQAFLTRDALDAIARTTLQNIADFENRRTSTRIVPLDRLKKS